MLLMILMTAGAHADDTGLDLRRGTYQLGGSATANIALVDSEPDVYLLIKPNGGIFVADRTELWLGLNMLVDEVEGFDVSVKQAWTTSCPQTG